MKKWFVWTAISIPIGFVLGLVLGFLWFLVGVIFLGYGDSGPAWANTMSNALLFGGLTAGILGGQFLFFFRDRIESYVGKLVKRKRPENTNPREKT